MLIYVFCLAEVLSGTDETDCLLGLTENASNKVAGHEIDGPSDRPWKLRT